MKTTKVFLLPVVLFILAGQPGSQASSEKAASLHCRIYLDSRVSGDFIDIMASRGHQSKMIDGAVWVFDSGNAGSGGAEAHVQPGSFCEIIK